MRPSRVSTISREEKRLAARPAESSARVRSWSFMSVCCPSAGEIEGRTRGKSAKVRCKPRHHLGDLAYLAEAVHRDLGEHVLDVLLGHLAEELGLDHGRGHAVHQHAGGGQF